MKHKIRNGYISSSVWGITFVTMILVGGIHTGLITLLEKTGRVHNSRGILLVLLFWILLSLGFTIFTRRQIKKAVIEPLDKIASFVSQVAKGNFSLYLPPLHSSERYDYFDMLVLDLNRMVEELGSIETLKTEFISNVSHEIKTPIAVIQNSAELLQNPSLTAEDRQQHVTTIIQASKRLSALITNILKLSKLEKKAILPQPQSYDLCRQLSECALQFEQVWEDKDITLDVELDDQIFVCSDASLMELVWTNLLSNAFKFTSTGGIVSIRQRVEMNTAVVTISDNGCGMSEETRKRIFDKFYQGDTSHSTEGNGLGLALVYRILQLMDGTIEVTSKLGEGSTFTVRIPCMKND